MGAAGPNGAESIAKLPSRATSPRQAELRFGARNRESSAGHRGSSAAGREEPPPHASPRSHRAAWKRAQSPELPPGSPLIKTIWDAGSAAEAPSAPAPPPCPAGRGGEGGSCRARDSAAPEPGANEAESRREIRFPPAPSRGAQRWGLFYLQQVQAPAGVSPAGSDRLSCPSGSGGD